ncbi:MAG: hypothetical protein JWQ64_12 [Subtercola sp.]|jgi:hypothetical protein|nr:hypothetical protein [Subtercola sp.]
MKITEVVVSRRSVLFGMGAATAAVATLNNTEAARASALRESPSAQQGAAVPPRKNVPVGLL